MPPSEARNPSLASLGGINAAEQLAQPTS